MLLVGMMGAGKSTVASLLADRLGWPLVDTDAMVESGRRTELSPRSSPATARRPFVPRRRRRVAALRAAGGAVDRSVGGRCRSFMRDEQLSHAGLPDRSCGSGHARRRLASWSGSGKAAFYAGGCTRHRGQLAADARPATRSR